MRSEVVIIGGGMAGLCAAYFLARGGREVTLLEKEAALGGLARPFRVNFPRPGRQGEPGPKDSLWLDRFYHFFLSKDRHIVALLQELGLGEEIIWQPLKFGIFSKGGIKFLGYLYEGEIVPFASTLDVLKTRKITLGDKIALVKIFRRLGKVGSFQELEGQTAREFFSSFGSKSLYEHIFAPLIYGKWGEAADEVSAAWLWARITSRTAEEHHQHHPEGPGSLQDAGCLKGSLHTLITRLEEVLLKSGVKIHMNTRATRIRVDQGVVKGVAYEGAQGRGEIETKCVLATIPIPQLLEIIQLPPAFHADYETIDYIAVICLALGLKERLSNFLRVVTMPGLASFGGIVEITNIVPPEHLKGAHLAYVFKFLHPQDRMYERGDDEIKKIFLGDLKRLLVNFNPEDVLWARVHRARFADPIFRLNYTSKMPKIQGPWRGLYLLGYFNALPVGDINQIIKTAKSGSTLVQRFLEQGN